MSWMTQLVECVLWFKGWEGLCSIIEMDRSFHYCNSAVLFGVEMDKWLIQQGASML